MPERTLTLPGLLVGVMLASASTYAMEVQLKTNPFERPVMSDSAADQPLPAKEPAADMALRGTMAAGRYSLADIGGEILSIGEEVNGYTLVAVHEHQVVLQKNDIQKTLSMDVDAEEKQ